MTATSRQRDNPQGTDDPSSPPIGSQSINHRAHLTEHISHEAHVLPWTSSSSHHVFIFNALTFGPGLHLGHLALHSAQAFSPANSRLLRLGLFPHASGASVGKSRRRLVGLPPGIGIHFRTPWHPQAAPAPACHHIAIFAATTSSSALQKQTSFCSESSIFTFTSSPAQSFRNLSNQPPGHAKTAPTVPKQTAAVAAVAACRAAHLRLRAKFLQPTVLWLYRKKTRLAKA